MHLSKPNILIVSKIMSLLRSIVHFLLGTQIPDIFTAVFGSFANSSRCVFQSSKPFFDLSAGSPVWFKIIGVSGKSRANLEAS